MLSRFLKTNTSKNACAALLLFLSSCGHYSDFTLPSLSGGNPNLTFAVEPRPEPVLFRGAGWDSRDVLNPSVVAARGSLVNLYSGYDGRTWHTGAATSDDGIHWTKTGKVLSPDPQTWEGSYIAANGSAVFYGGQEWYWYQAGPRGKHHIGLARSSDLKTWRKEPKPVLDPGPRGSWDEEAVADPYVIRIDPYFYLYYLGQDRAQRQRLGVARSDDGIHFEKLRTNPILEGEIGAFDERLGEPSVWSSNGFYWMLYTGRDVAENRRLGLARSTDGVHFQKLAAVFSGDQTWNSKVLCDPTVVVEPGTGLRGPTIRVWFGGGDVASPDENLNGQIGYAILRPVNATLAK
jgi:predicted GH43/DUF377 family glycosyl hydrolase